MVLWWARPLLTLLIMVMTAAMAHACGPEVEARIIGQYRSQYHQSWGPASRREAVDVIIDRLAKDIEPILQGGSGQLDCRFSAVIERAPPTTTILGPKLSPDAATTPAVLEIVSDSNELCVGLNDLHHRMLPPNMAFPNEVRHLPRSQFGLSYTYYAMKCFTGGEFNGRYIFY